MSPAASSDESQDKPEVEIKKRVKIDYIKSQFFRVVHSDGVFGGVTPDLMIDMVFWNNRVTIPQTVIAELDGGGLKEIDRITRADMIREAEVAVLMNLDAAEALREWLDDKIKKAKLVVEKLAEDTKNDNN